VKFSETGVEKIIQAGSTMPSTKSDQNSKRELERHLDIDEALKALEVRGAREARARVMDVVR
jgi:hypothetical protein